MQAIKQKREKDHISFIDKWALKAILPGCILKFFSDGTLGKLLRKKF